MVEFGYDSMGRRTWEKQNGKTVGYAYDVLSNLKSITYPNGRVVEREHDLMGQIKKISISGIPIATFDFSGRRLAGKTYGNGDVTTYTYDLPGYRPIAIEAKNKNDAIISLFAYGYDLYNLKTHEKRIHDSGKGDSYTYDALNRIKTVKVNSTQPENPNNATFEVNKDYSIDKVDNLLKITENRDNVVTEILAERDANSTKLNQYTSFNGKVMSYDANGNLSAKGNQNFSYDFKNRLVKAEQPGSTVDFKYDVFGRQIEKRFNASTVQQFNYFYAGDQRIEERNESDNVIRQFLYGNGIDEIVRVDRNESGTLVPYYYHLNEIGSVTSITDNNGALVERINYDTFGKPTFTDFKTDPQNPQVRTTSIIGNDVLFQGREYDTDIVLYNYRARYYDPEMGRFLQTDPIGYKDNMNMYQGMILNTYNFIDPMGLFKGNFIINPHEYSSRDELAEQYIKIGITKENNKIYKALTTITDPYGRQMTLDDSFKYEFITGSKPNKFRILFEFNFEIHVYYVPSDYSGIAHENRHVRDIEATYNKIASILKKIEKFEFPIEKKDEIEKTINKFKFIIVDWFNIASKNSKFFLDTFILSGFFELPRLLVDEVLSWFYGDEKIFILQEEIEKRREKND